MLSTSADMIDASRHPRELNITSATCGDGAVQYRMSVV